MAIVTQNWDLPYYNYDTGLTRFALQMYCLYTTILFICPDTIIQVCPVAMKSSV